MDFSLQGKKAIITGADHGNLGPIWKETLLSAGAYVTSFDLPEYDITKSDDIKLFGVKYRNAHHIPNILINNAAIDPSPVNGIPTKFFDNFESILSVNITGAVKLCEELIPDMIANGGGVIVNIGSIQGYGGADHSNYEDGFEKSFGYNASKWALRGLAKSLTTQYGRFGIRSVTISFGPFCSTKLSPEFVAKFNRRVPLNRTISRESMAMTLLYACCCPELAGVDWRVDGGLGSWA